MADLNEKDKKTRQEIAIGGTLTALFDGTDPKNFKDMSSVKFLDKNTNEFKSYKEFGNKEPVTDTSRVAIKVDGETEPHYYKKVYQSVESHKEADKSDKPKMSTWVRTDDKGNIQLDKEGKVERFDTYNGFKGDVNAKNKQTDAVSCPPKTWSRFNLVV
jgi:hypothetical protein